MIEPSIGDRVKFRQGNGMTVGTVTTVITAGRAQGRGLFALRRRARIRFEADGQSWETHRDLDAIAIVACDEQRSLFDEIEVTV